MPLLFQSLSLSALPYSLSPALRPTGASSLDAGPSQFSLEGTDSKTSDLRDASTTPTGSAHVESGPISFASQSDVDSKRSRRELSSIASVTSSRAKQEMSSLFGVELDEELSRIISQNISFEGAHHLMRAVRLSRVLAGRASIFNDSRGSAATYELSEHATSLRYFFSHNWCVSRWDKFLALNLKFNGDMALFFTLLFCVVCGICGSLDLLPVIHDHSYDASVGYVCRLFCCPLAFIVLSFGQSMASYIGWRGPLVFLDKVCIHQTDAGLQQQGIARLGAFLRISERMLVLYSDIYLQKLWTILEMANFLALHSVEDIEVMPVMLPRLMFATFPLCYLVVTLVMVCLALDMPGAVQYPFLLIAGSIYSIMLRRWARHKKEMQERLRQFEVRQCHCAVESDRPVVYAKIADLMRARGLIDRRASIEEGLEAFNLSIRKQMPQAFAIIFRRGSLTYKNCLFVASMLVLPASMDRVVLLHHGVPDMEVAAALIRDALWVFTAWPLALFLMEVLASRNLHWTGWKQHGYLLAVVVFLVSFFYAIHIQISELESRAGSDGLVLELFAAGTGLAIVLTWLAALVSAQWTPCKARRTALRHRRHRRGLAALREQQRKEEAFAASRATTVVFDLETPQLKDSGVESWHCDLVTTAVAEVAFM